MKRKVLPRHTVTSMRYAPVPVCRPTQICRKVNSANVSATRDASNWLSKSSFLDVRRWKLYDNVTSTGETGKPRYNQLLNLYGVKVTGSADTPSYTFGLAETVNSRTFVNPKSYYFPIPANEVKRAPNLGQNPGWDTGSASNE